MHTPPRTAAEPGNQARVRIRAATAFISGTNGRIAQDGSRSSRLTKNMNRPFGASPNRRTMSAFLPLFAMHRAGQPVIDRCAQAVGRNG